MRSEQDNDGRIEQRPLSAVLGVLGEEATELTRIAAHFDEIMPSVLQNRQATDGRFLSGLQDIDRLHQYLAETARGFAKLTTLIDPDGRIDTAALSDHARLAHFKTRLRGGTAPASTGGGGRESQLF